MIKLFTQNFLTYDHEWGTAEEDGILSEFNEVNSPAEYLSPSDESIAKLKCFARSFVVDLSMDPNYTYPVA
ncbi:MAG: hypothetical protein K6F48_09030 [Paludibacteraceae bacterium]|nr:hypothetical protein [Paludibacteraceae bacterium]